MIKPVSVYADDTASMQDWIIYEYNETNGLPTGEANAVLQTRDGYMWIGSYGGLIRYDGTTFRNYSEEGSILSSSIRSLFEDSQGRLWIGTNDKGVYLYDNHEFIQYVYENSNEFLSVRSFAEGEDGTIYVGTTSGLAKIENQQLVLVNEDVYGITIYSMAVDRNGILWACTDNGKAIQLDGDSVIGTFQSDELLDAALYCVDTGNTGNLFLGTRDNFIYQVEIQDKNYNNNSYVFHKYFIGDLSTVNDIAQDKQGNIWVAAMNGTGYFDTYNNWNPMYAEHASGANGIVFDYEGNVWISSGNYGILHFVDGLYYHINETAGLSENSINVVEICKDYYYLGTDTGLIILNRQFQPIENELTELLKGERIRSILYDSNGNIWIGTYYQYGLILYDPETETITQFTKENGMSDEQIRMIMECADGRIAVATQHGITILQDKQVVQTYTEENGLTFSVILCMCEGKDGTLYAGSDGQGIYEIKNGQITNFGFDEGLSSGVILRMQPEPDGTGMFISAGNSLYYWNFESFQLLDNYNKSPGSIFDINLEQDEVWLMQSNGINILNRQQLLSGEDTPVKVIGVTDGLIGTLDANTWNAKEQDTIYLCTSKGLAILKLSELNSELRDIQTAIQQAVVDDTIYEAPDQIMLDKNVTRLTIRFAVLTYTGQKVTVRYRLKGFDEEAHMITSGQSMGASYTNLRGGDYEFVLEVLGEDGITVLNSQTIQIHKQNQLWEYAWFWIGIVFVGILVLTGILWLCVHAKTMRLKRRQEEYQSIVEQALRTFANTIDAKDPYTNGHSMRVAAYSLEIARKLKLTKEEQEQIYCIALLHDIGKIGISDEILNKPGKLTPEEREIIKSHPTIGGEILKDFTSLPGISEGARYHHERYDGQGYNEGLKGEEIPFFARIICVADSYDAMSSARCYRSSMDKDSIVEELKRCSGKQFDPKIVEIMLEIIEEGKVPIHVEESALIQWREQKNS